VIRSGFGVFYARLQGAMLDNLYLTNGVYQPSVFVQPTSPGSPVFPNIYPSSVTGLPSGSVNLQFASQGLRKPYTMQSDFAIERQLSNTMAFTASYIWSRGVQFFTVRDLNTTLSNRVVTYRINDASGNQVGTYATQIYTSKLDPRYNELLQIDNGGQTWYNALVLQLTKRLSHGLQGSVAYTWSHALDDFEQGGGSTVVFPGITTIYNGDFRPEKATSALDQRHRLNITTLWAPTFSSGSSWVSRYLLNGWSLSQITTLGSTQPAQASVNVSNSAAYNTANGFLRTNTLNGFGGSTAVPFLPLNSLKIDTIHRVDARLTKDLPFTERFHLSLFFEAFNVFNTISNTGVFTTAYTAVNGVLTPNTQVGQGNASQGFPDGTNARRMQVGARFVF
jgi:hypothetical protein